MKNQKHSKRKTLNKPTLFAEEFLITADLFPERIAICTSSKRYTYSEFRRKIEQIYAQIQSEEIENKRIALWANSDIETYAALFAISLSGRSYVPLNTKHPEERILKILNQSKASHIITSSLIPYCLENFTKITIDQLASIEKESYCDPSKLFQNESSEACVIFTSGTTNEPKGVPLYDKGLKQMLDHFSTDPSYFFTEEDRFLQVFDLSFDFSIFSLMLPIRLGAACYILPQQSVKTIDIIKTLEEEKISVVAMVPNVLRILQHYLDEIRLPDLRYTFFGGDTLYHTLATKWSRSCPNGKIVNVYGPTESSVICSTYLWEEKKSEEESIDGIVSIGKTFADIKCLIVDEKNNPIEIGEKGELCFSGKQVIESYLDPIQNENKFFDYIWDGKKVKFYKTSDLGAWNKQQNLIFHGRKDRQIKISGYRVDLNEIDYCLFVANEKAAYSMLAENPITKKMQLISFVESHILTEEKLISQLKAHLPKYMIPATILLLDKLPYNLNGKIDRRKLLLIWENKIISEKNE